MDASVAALLGAGLGVLGTVLAAAVNSRTSARSQEQLLASEAEGKKLDSLQEAVDAAGSALERMHWALMAAVQLGRFSAAPSGEDWDEALDEIEHARAETSLQGTRLAVRLGTHAECVGAYDEKKDQYWEFIKVVSSIETGPAVDIDKVEKDLGTLGKDHRFLDLAALLLKPASVT